MLRLFEQAAAQRTVDGASEVVGLRGEADVEDPLGAYRDLLCQNRRLRAQVRLFDALRRAPEHSRRLAELIQLDHVSVSTSVNRSDNARRAVHERARALQRSLQTLSARFGPHIGTLCWMSWDQDEGEGRGYRLEVAPCGEAVPARGQRHVLQLRATAQRVLDSLGMNGA